MHPVETYLRDCHAHRGVGTLTPETSLYAPLAALLTAVGHTLKPRVRCFMSLKNQAGNMPDGGLPRMAIGVALLPSSSYSGIVWRPIAEG